MYKQKKKQKIYLCDSIKNIDKKFCQEKTLISWTKKIEKLVFVTNEQISLFKYILFIGFRELPTLNENDLMENIPCSGTSNHQ